MSGPRFSLIILGHDNGAALQALVARALSLRALGLEPEIFIAGKAAGPDTARIAGPAFGEAQHNISLLPPGPSRGATLQRALATAKGDFIGLIEAEGFYRAPELPALLAPCLEGRADAVFASRRLGERVASSFWCNWRGSLLTLTAGMLSNLELSDPFCPCKIFTAAAAAKIMSGPGTAIADRADLAGQADQAGGADLAIGAGHKGGWPGLRGDGPGLEAEIAARAFRAGLRVLECPLVFDPQPDPAPAPEPGPEPGPEPCRDLAPEAGDLLSAPLQARPPAQTQTQTQTPAPVPESAPARPPSLADSLRALYGIIHHCAPFAPLPAQMLIYLFIGAASLFTNLLSFMLFLHLGAGAGASVILAFICSSFVNYLLCVALLFRSKARWSGPVEAAAFFGVVLFMGLVDYGVTLGLMALDSPPLIAKFCGAVIGFFLNFFLRRQVVFRIGRG